MEEAGRSRHAQAGMRRQKQAGRSRQEQAGRSAGICPLSLLARKKKII